MRKVSDFTEEDKKAFREATAEAFKELQSYYYDNKEAIDFLYGVGREKQRYDLLGSINDKTLEACFNRPTSEKLKAIIATKTKTDEEREEKLVSIYEELTIAELITLYHYLKPADTVLLPLSSTLNQINRTFSSIGAGALPAIPAKGKLSVMPGSDNRLIVSFESESGRDKTFFEFQDAKLFSAVPELIGDTSSTTRNGREARTYKGLRRMLAFILTICNENGFRNVTTFDIHEKMVKEYHMYSTTQKAIEGLEKHGNMISKGLYVSSYSKRGKTEKTTGFDTGGSFIRIKTEGTIAKIMLDPEFDVFALAENYTLLPKWAFSLDPNPFALIQYIFEYARRKASDVSKNHYIDIKFEAIRQNLGLPDYVANNDYKKIRLPIEKAIEKIETAITEYSDHSIKLEPTIEGMKIEDAKTKEWLYSGYLRVRLTDTYLNYFSSRAKAFEDRRSEAERKKNKKYNAVADAHEKEVNSLQSS